jgi:hypothetical protein
VPVSTSSGPHGSAVGAREHVPVEGTGPARAVEQHRARPGQARPAHQMIIDAPQERIQHRLVEAAEIVDPIIQPYTMLLNICARSLRDLSLRRAMCQERISRPNALPASLLTAGRKFTKCFPHLFLANRGVGDGTCSPRT